MQGAFEGVEKIGAVNGELRGAIALFRRRAHRQPRGLLARIPCAADAELRAGRRPAKGLADAEAVERVDGIGREIDVGADAAEGARPLGDGHLMPLLLQGDRGSHSSDTAAGNHDLHPPTLCS